MTPLFAAWLCLGVMGLFVGIAALDNLFRAVRCAWVGHSWHVVYPAGAWGPRMAECAKCGRRAVQA